MAIIALPVTTGFLRKIDWEFNRPAQVNVSGYTGRRQVVANPWHSKWTASCDFAPVVGETNMRMWRAFFAQLKGQINTFRLPATEGAQSVGAISVAINLQAAAAAGATSIVTQGWNASVAAMTAGELFTVNDQLCVLTNSPVSSGSGFATFTFEPPLRAAAAGSTAVEVINPTCLVALADSSFGYSVEPGKIYGMTMKVEEAF